MNVYPLFVWGNNLWYWCSQGLRSVGLLVPRTPMF